MSNPKLVRIDFVLDKSGSMDTLKESVVIGINEFLVSQKADEAQDGIQRLFSLFVFNDMLSSIYSNLPLSEIPLMTVEDYMPKDTTAMYDAIGNVISIILSETDMLPEADRPGKHIMVIMTDGLENASKRYVQRDIFDKITALRANGWEFIFKGANIDAYAVGGGIGVAVAMTSNWMATGSGVSEALNVASRIVTKTSRQL